MAFRHLSQSINSSIRKSVKQKKSRMSGSQEFNREASNSVA